MSEPLPPGMLEACWPDAGEIECIYVTGEPVDRVPSFSVGQGEVTLLEKWGKPGPHCWLPYVRVWCGERLHSEHCQHALAGVYFKAPG